MHMIWFDDNIHVPGVYVLGMANIEHYYYVGQSIGISQRLRSHANNASDEYNVHPISVTARELYQYGGLNSYVAFAVPSDMKRGLTYAEAAWLEFFRRDDDYGRLLNKRGLNGKKYRYFAAYVVNSVGKYRRFAHMRDALIDAYCQLHRCPGRVDEVSKLTASYWPSTWGD